MASTEQHEHHRTSCYTKKQITCFPTSTSVALQLAVAAVAFTTAEAFSINPKLQSAPSALSFGRKPVQAEFRPVDFRTVSRTVLRSVAPFADSPASETESAECTDKEIEVNALQQAEELEELLKHSAPQADGLVSSFDPFNIEHGGKVESGDIVRTEREKSTEVHNSAASEEKEPEVADVWRARLLVIVAAALYGTNFSMVKILDESIPVGVSATLRFSMAALAALPWLLAPAKVQLTEKVKTETAVPKVASSSTRGRFHGWWEAIQSSTAVAAGIAGFEVGMWNSVGYIAQAVGLETTQAGKSAFICSLAVVIVPILDFLTGKKFLPRELVGAAMAVAGVGLLEFGGVEGIHRLSSGDIASLIQPFAFGLGFWRMEATMHRFPNEATRTTAGQIFAVFLASATYCLFFSGGEALPPMTQIMAWLTDPMIFGALLWTGIVTTALTVYMETLALKTLTAAETTMIFSTEPLWGAAFAALVLGERFGVEAGMGAALILSGIVFSNVGADWIMGQKEQNETNEGEPVSSSSRSVAEVMRESFAGSGIAGMVGGAVSQMKDSGFDEIVSDSASAVEAVEASIAPSSISAEAVENVVRSAAEAIGEQVQ